jgi:hypothetical protein
MFFLYLRAVGHVMLPITESTLCNYAAILATGDTSKGVRQVNLETIKKKIGNVCGHIASDGKSKDPRTFNNKGHVVGMLSRVYKGIDRTTPYERRTRYGLTNTGLTRIITHLESLTDVNIHDRTTISAALLFIQGALLRPSECLAPTTIHQQDPHDPTHTSMTRQDIKMMSGDDGKTTAIDIYVRRSKTNNHGVHLTPLMAVDNKQICPVSNLKAYLRLPSRDINGPLFVLQDGSFLTLGTLDTWIKRLTFECGMGDMGYSTYSLRIGGTMALANAGCSAEYIKKVGRWRSDTYLIYIREFALSKHKEVADKRANAIDIDCLDMST